MSARRGPGRPRAEDITDALKKAAERTMSTDGYSKLSIDALSNEVGTTRPTFYRRFSSVAELVLEVVRDAFSPGLNPNTGTLRGDLLALQRETVTMFSSPLVSKSLAGLLEAVRADPAVRDAYREEFVGPRRANIARVLDAAVERGEVESSRLDSEFICDMLVGPILSRVLLPVDSGLDDKLARDTVDAVCRYLATDCGPTGR